MPGAAGEQHAVVLVEDGAYHAESHVGHFPGVVSIPACCREALRRALDRQRAR
eukprot:COSAG03_NODE_4235_length_1628_cov_0.920209_4_plen_52_part_01